MKRCFVQLNGLNIVEFVTDRHPQIRKEMREHFPSITHSFDTWHIHKGLEH